MTERPVDAADYGDAGANTLGPVGMPATGGEVVAEADCLDGVLGFQVLEHAVARFPIRDRVRRRFGLVHGGAYAALAEMLATEATVRVVYPQGNAAMGISNDTSFLRGARGEWITARARARHRGRTTWVWEIDHTDDEGRLCAVSRVTIAVRPRPES
jgi:1,4-dihydroxy-2-naphthoyl-CoA hydrolase